MSQKINSTIENIGEKDRPAEVTIEFGIKFDGDLDVEYIYGLAIVS
ncbi:MAG: hypothetical protein ACR2IS_15510 [Nitrososphaeraceae archaeon]